MHQFLLEAGAKIDAQGADGATPLHRAMHNRCSGAVEYHLERGIDPKAKNKSGSTPFHLADQNTRRGGSGAIVAKEAQARIIHLLLQYGASVKLRDGDGKTVLECASDAAIQWRLALKAD